MLHLQPGGLAETESAIPADEDHGPVPLGHRFGELHDLGCVLESDLTAIHPGEMLQRRGRVPRQSTRPQSGTKYPVQRTVALADRRRRQRSCLESCDPGVDGVGFDTGQGDGPESWDDVVAEVRFIPRPRRRSKVQAAGHRPFGPPADSDPAPPRVDLLATVFLDSTSWMYASASALRAKVRRERSCLEGSMWRTCTRRFWSVCGCVPCRPPLLVSRLRQSREACPRPHASTAVFDAGLPLLLVL